MRGRVCLVVAALILGVWPADSSGTAFVNQDAAVRIIFPLGYRSQSFTLAMADFGKPLYGGVLAGRVVYYSEDASLNPWGKAVRCSGPTACQYGCTPFTGTSPPVNVTKPPGTVLIFLLDRGPRDTAHPCYFLTKVFNAQQAGADAVLVVNDEAGDMSTAVVPDEEDVAKLAESLHVGAGLISKSDGQLIKDLLRGQANVTVALNWTALMPRAQKVSWELWGNSNDECGTVCREQIAFVRAMRPYARALDQAGVATFSPHYLLYTCPVQYMGSAECASECILNGTYCAPDPDGSIKDGYRGTDVLAMNVRQLCAWRVAAAANSSWLWWDYMDAFAANCTTATQAFTHECAARVFASLGGGTLAAGGGADAWAACIATGTPPPDGSPPPPPGTNATLPLFEQELLSQHGGDGVDPVNILPTIRINGRNYRGALDAASVMRALCAAFPLDAEPAVCNEKWVSDNECEVGGPGYKACRVGDPAAGGHTRCVNTFSGYKCECSAGWVRATTGDLGLEACEDLNECVATNVRITDPQCSCARCACINTPGAYKCTGELPNKCTPQYDYGGCWRTTVDGNVVHACSDTVSEYQRLASRGVLAPTDQWYTCKCPGCYAPPSATVPTTLTCEASCAPSRCLQPAGICLPPSDPVRPPASGGGSGRGSGVSWWGVLLAIALTAGGCYALYETVLRSRMRDEIRDIMSQYMPLAEARGGGGGTRPVEESAPLLGTNNRNRGGGGDDGGRGAGGYAPPSATPLPEAESSPAVWGPPGGLASPGTGRTPFGSLLRASGGGDEAGPGGGGGGSRGQTGGVGVTSGRRSVVAAGASQPAAAAPAAAAPVATAPLVNDAPLLGDGPL